MVVLKFSTLDSALTPSVFYFSWNRNVSFSSYVSPELAPSTLSFNQHFDKKKHFDRTSFKHKRSSLPLLLISGWFTSSIVPWLDADSNQTKRGNFLIQTSQGGSIGNMPRAIGVDTFSCSPFTDVPCSCLHEGTSKYWSPLKIIALCFQVIYGNNRSFHL